MLMLRPRVFIVLADIMPSDDDVLRSLEPQSTAGVPQAVHGKVSIRIMEPTSLGFVG